MSKPRRQTRSAQSAAHSPALVEQFARFWKPLVIVTATLTVYANSFSAPFVFDGARNIRENPGLQRLWPAGWLFSNRPLGNLSFIANYVVHGHWIFGYHLVNVTIHALAALTLFGIVRRTLRLPGISEDFRAAADRLAVVAALVWAVHPLQTQSVTYLYQRYEALMGWLFLLTLYCFLRAQGSNRPLFWYVGSAAACLAGIASKEVMIVAPFVIIWYDRAFLSSSWKELFRRHGAFHASLLATLGVLAAIMLQLREGYFRAGIFRTVGISPTDYARSQPAVILHYLRLVFCPVGQCLDYDWPPVRSWSEAALPLATLGILLLVSAWAVIRWPRWGFLAGCFFGVLAPTSSVVPVRDLAFEHRMYLPLAAVVVASVLLVYQLGRSAPMAVELSGPAQRTLGFALAAMVVVGLGGATIARNRVYHSEEAVWEDVVAKAPHNDRAHANLGAIKGRNGRYDEAIEHHLEAIRLGNTNAEVRCNLGMALAKTGRGDPVAAFAEALRLEPDYGEAHLGLANYLFSIGRQQEAVAHYRRAVERMPHSALAHYNLGTALAAVAPQEAERHYRTALELEPDYAEVHYNLANLLARQGRYREAIVHYRATLQVMPGHRGARQNLDTVLDAVEQPLPGRSPPSISDSSHR